MMNLRHIAPQQYVQMGDLIKEGTAFCGEEVDYAKELGIMNQWTVSSKSETTGVTKVEQIDGTNDLKMCRKTREG